MKTALLVVILIIVAAAAFCIPSADGLVPFVPPWDDASHGPTDLSSLLPKPAGKLGFVKAKGAHLYSGKNRVRFFGVNFTTTACFPEPAEAEKIAARMAKYGINCVRFHHMDASWISEGIFEDDKRTISPQRLEKLDYFIYQLKKHGIYTNLNLHVSREYPNMPNYPGRPGFCKGLDIFYPPMIDSQKQYARDLLTHVNPYTKTRYVDEPAVAIVEINNENGLVWTWVTWGLDGMSQEYNTELSRLWNNWLKKKYASDEKLRQAWKAANEPLGPEMLRNPDFSANEESWVVEKFAPDAASLEIVESAGFDSAQPADRSLSEVEMNNGGASGFDSAQPAGGRFARMRVMKTDGTAWHVQLQQPGVSLKKDKTYTLTIKLRADKNLQLGVSAQHSGDPWTVVWSSQLPVGPEWVERRLVVRPDRDDSRLTIKFPTLGAQTAVVDFALVSLKEGAQLDDFPGKLGEFSMVRRVDIDTISPGLRTDWLQFMCDTESDYWVDMKDYIVKKLGSKSLIVGTAAPFSPTATQAKMDVVDAHNYWQHPQFPGAAWDGANWIVGNVSMAGQPGGGTLGELGAQRAFGKPFIVTEYNHSAPNTYASEGFPELAMYACLQDWDGIFAFDYLSDKTYTQADKINGFFDIAHHPTKMASLVAAASMFLRGDVKPISETRSVNLAPADWAYLILTGNPWSLGSSMGFTGSDAMQHRVGQTTGKPSSSTARSTATAEGVYRAQGMLWDTVKKTVTLNSPKSRLFIGSCKGESVKLGDVSVQVTKSLLDWAAITVTAMKGSSIATSPSILITATGYAQNTGMMWNNDRMDSVGSNWGTAPSLVECISARITVPARKGLRVWSLDERGQRARQVPVTVKGKQASFTIGPEFKTIWYEVGK